MPPSQLTPASNKDIVDSLRQIGLDSMVKLPAVIVGGDTSAGKSSLLTAVSGLEFPSSAGLTTRCPIEVMLTGGPKKSAVVELRFEGTEQPIDFHRTLKEDWSDFASVVIEATDVLTNGKDPNYITPSAIVVRAEEPDLPDLTLIDLPGLVAATGTGESKEMISSIQQMIHGHMTSSRTVILCVLPANNDFHNSAILTMAKDFFCDPAGIRTLGIITKPDLVDKGSENEVVSLAKNEKVGLKLGWHTVKLRSQQSVSDKLSLAEAEKEESLFFSGKPWSVLEPSEVGIGQLRKRLQRLLAERIQSELPLVFEEATKRLEQEKKDLDRMGEDYDTLPHQRGAFVNFLGDCSALLEKASRGHYQGDFFVQATPPYCNNLRARIFKLEEQFRNEIGQTRFVCVGHYAKNDKITYAGHQGVVQEVCNNASQVIVVLTKSRERQTVPVNAVSPDHSDMLRLLENARGDAVPGFCEYSVFQGLVAEKLAPWSEPAKQLFAGVAKLLKEVATRVVEHVVPPSLSKLQAFLKRAVGQAIERHSSELKLRMQELLLRERERPHTQNPDYMEQLLNLQRQLASRLANHPSQATAALAAFCLDSNASVEERMAVDLEFRLAAYIAVASKRFMDEMPQTLDTVLVKPVVKEMQKRHAHTTDAELSSLFAEDDKVKQVKKLRGNRIKMLEDAIEVIGAQQWPATSYGCL